MRERGCRGTLYRLLYSKIAWAEDVDMLAGEGGAGQFVPMLSGQGVFP